MPIQSAKVPYSPVLLKDSAAAVIKRTAESKFDQGIGCPWPSSHFPAHLITTPPRCISTTGQRHTALMAASTNSKSALSGRHLAEPTTRVITGAIGMRYRGIYYGRAVVSRRRSLMFSVPTCWFPELTRWISVAGLASWSSVGSRFLKPRLAGDHHREPPRRPQQQGCTAWRGSIVTQFVTQDQRDSIAHSLDLAFCCRGGGI
jgi:hypothetical protein